MAVVVRVMQELLRERVPLRNLRSIAETLTERGAKTQEPAALVAAVRVALGRALVHGIAGYAGELPAMTLDPDLERLLSQAIQAGVRRRPRSSPASRSACIKRWSMVRRGPRDQGNLPCC